MAAVFHKIPKHTRLGKLVRCQSPQPMPLLLRKRSSSWFISNLGQACWSLPYFSMVRVVQGCWSVCQRIAEERLNICEVNALW